ncbi:Rft protein-domain-containing protein [Crassisporium funariophilum]|nr:Rft protein-domain-containing protein [Crassisporium funariophilum]
MPPISYSGALQPKKKSELQDIALALRLSDQGTKDELQVRIKKHLDNNQDALEEDPAFAGLFGRRKRSVQPQAAPASTRFAPSTSDIAEKPKSSTIRLDPIRERESTPNNDLRDVSMFLKRPFSPVESTPNQSQRHIDATTPSSLPPLPPSPTKSLIDHLPNAADMRAAVQQFKQQEVLQNGNELLMALRGFLSNSRNIWSVTAVLELLYVLYTIIPWKYLHVPLSQKADAGMSIPYPPLSVFSTAAFWHVILHWAIPTLFIPAFLGSLISFNPASAPSQQRTESNVTPAAAIAPLDPLTASIVRLAAQVGYPYATLGSTLGVIGLDVLGSNWRVLSASVSAAFAFAEAIAGAPQIFAKTLIREQRQAIQFNHDDQRQRTPSRRALMHEEETSEGSTDTPGGLLNTSITSASSLMALQLFSRLFTFALNQALFRLASPSAFGAAAIQFELILSTILFLSREGVRNALLRVSKHADRDTAIRRMNISFLPVILGVPLAIFTSFVYARFASEEMKLQQHFRIAIALYALAAVSELLSEPLYNRAISELKTGVRVRAEGLGITSKSLTTFLILFYDATYGQDDLALVAFATGQLVYSVVMFATYVAHFGSQHMRPKVPSRTRNLLDHIDQDLLGLSLTMTSQSLVKHFLTEGDKFILSWFSPLHDQGGYAIAVNYGSLIARIILQPIEETLRVYFSRILPGPSKDRNSDEKTESVTQSANTLISLLSVQTSLSIVLVIFGSAYLPILLPLLLPPQYLTTSAPQVLTAWVWYIPVLALNGGLEAFLSSVATPADLNKQSRWMVGFSVIYIIATIFFYRLGLGDASLVYANVLNLTARIIYALQFATTYFANSGAPDLFGWQNALPSRVFVVVSMIAAVIIQISQKQLQAERIVAALGRASLLNPWILLHIGIGATLAIICLGTWWRTSGRYLKLGSSRAKVD